MKKTLYLLLFTALGMFFLISGCEQKKTQEGEKDTEKKINTTETVNNELGASLMVSNCYACHNPKAEHDKRVAPPMAGIKKHYLEEFSSKEDFVNAMVEFVDNPSQDKSVFPPMAIKKFGLMPNMSFPKDKIKIIAQYMYDNEIETPQWMAKHEKSQENKAKPYKEGDFSEMGLHFAMTTKGQLGKNLVGTIKKEGTLAALEFCNVRAYPLTDSMSVLHQAEIKRVSDKPRNQANAANEQELKHIETFKNMLVQGEEIKPILEESDNAVSFYYPIKTNKMCMQCHGNKRKDIKAEVLAGIKSLYPKDKAFGYFPNQIRGIWSIKMKKNN